VIWQEKFKDGYRLDDPKEDSRYGTLLLMMKRYENGGPILDFGCGDGLLQERFRSLSSAHLIGIDYARAGIERARARGIPDCEFICTDYRRFQPSEKCSLLVFNETLYYVDDYLEVIDRMADHLIPDGHIVISMFETRVTARIWKNLAGRLSLVQGALTFDEQSRRSWTVRVFAHPRLSWKHECCEHQHK
jgi:trans-aconitate methyltransferase